MKKALLGTIKTRILSLQDGDILVFHVGDVKANLIPTQKDLEEVRRMFQKELTFGKNITIAVFPPYITPSIIRKKKSKKK